MVWFQCEGCGEDLKKPKLQNHFRICSANKFSCIDCGFTFNRESVQAHTQCVSEQEKYGPKAEGKGISNSEAKRKPTSQNCDVDLSVGLTIRPPWCCRLCNVETTSKETLLQHSEGKKHRSKARAVQASNKSDQTVAPSSNGNSSSHKPGDIITSKEQSKIADLRNGEMCEEFKGAETYNSLNKQNIVKPKNEEVEHLVCDNKKQDGALGKKEPNIEEEKHSKKRKWKGDKSDLLESGTFENNRKYKVVKQEEGDDPVCANNKQDFAADLNQDKNIEKEKDSKKKKKKGDQYSDFNSVNVDNKQDQAAKQKPIPKNVGTPTSLSGTKKLKSSKMEKRNEIDAIDRGKFNDEHNQVNNVLDSGNGSVVDAVENANRNAKESSKLPVKWKKIITSVLESSPDKSLRTKKLQKGVVPLVMKALELSGVSADESHVKDELMKKVLSSSRFVVDQKVVRLA